MATFTSKINGNDIYAKRAEATRKGVNLETYGEGASQVKGILPAGLVPGNEGTNDANILATQQYVLNQVGTLAEALIYKGVVDGTHGLPAEGYKVGWTYKVAEDGTYAGKKCEIGDMIIANKDYGTGHSNVDWDVIQTNIDGAVVNTDTSVVDGHIPVFSGTSGKTIVDGIDPAILKIKQKTVSVTGDTLKGVASFSQNENGEATLVLNDIQSASTSQPGVVQLQGTIGASEAEDSKAATPKAVRDAITGAVEALDADVTSASGTKVQVEVVEADGKVTGVTVTETGLDTALATKADKVTNAVEGNFAGLDANGNLTDSGHKHSDYKTQQTTVDESVSALKTLTRIQQNANGEITPTFSDIQSASTSQPGVVQLAGSIGVTVSTENNKAASEKAVRDAINALDATNVTGASNGITVKVTEADGIITNVTVEATAATAGGAAGLVSYETEELPD